LKQFIDQLSDEENSLNIPDIKHNSSLVSNLYSKLIGLLPQSKYKLIADDCKAVVIFVVGGIMASEVSDIKNKVQYYNLHMGEKSPFHGRSIIIGSTSFANSEHIYRHVFLESEQ
jgi:hypothetical protein